MPRATELVPVTCPVCNTQFQRRYSDLRRGLGITCSGVCGQKLRHSSRDAQQERRSKLLAMIDTSSGQNGCWEWKGYRNSNGYGVVGRQGKTYLVHRLVYQEHYNTDPGDLSVCHSCDNPACCNPAHLWLGSAKDNVHDCIQKGRFRRATGTKNSNSKLTDEKVLAIRKIHRDGAKRADIALATGLSWSTINQIVRGSTWKHVVVQCSDTLPSEAAI